MAKTKIIATLGPSSSSETIIRKMISRGLDIVRLNFSHGTSDSHIQRIKIVRKLNKNMRRAVKIMQDLEGHRIRIGELRRPIILKKNKEFYFTQEAVKGTGEEIHFDYKGSLKRISKGTLIYIDDGKIVLSVKLVGKKRLRVKVVIPGVLNGNKGVNIPGIHLDFDCLSNKDKRDLESVLPYKLDYVAQLFVRNTQDLVALKSIIKHKHPQCRIFSKIENREALVNLDSIIEESDGIIVARGDLGVCLPIYKVPVIQKEIVKRCILKKKEVVVATQMLESMTVNDLPTRAEASDVANAILDGATHLLLSGETAVGRHPDKVIDMMNKLIINTENYKQELEDLLK